MYSPVQNPHQNLVSDVWKKAILSLHPPIVPLFHSGVGENYSKRLQYKHMRFNWEIIECYPPPTYACTLSSHHQRASVLTVETPQRIAKCKFTQRRNTQGGPKYIGKDKIKVTQEI